LEFIEAALKFRKINYKRACRGQKLNYNHFDFIITVGGDGTFLEASRHIKDQMILGVNSDPSWSVGRFCVVNSKNFETILDLILKEKAKVKLFQRMELSFNNKQHIWNVLNDCLFCHTNPAAMSRYRLTFGRIKEDQRSSGVWVATAAGSTGAIHSAGASVLNPNSNNFQYKPRELYKGLKTAYRLKGGLVRPGQSLRITSLIREGIVYIDGSHVSTPFTFGETAKLTLSTHPLRTFEAI
jgi:NAD+ kinase